MRSLVLVLTLVSSVAANAEVLQTIRLSETSMTLNPVWSLITSNGVKECKGKSCTFDVPAKDTAASIELKCGTNSINFGVKLTGYGASVTKSCSEVVDMPALEGKCTDVCKLH